MLGNHKGFLHLGSIPVGNLYGDSIAVANRSFDPSLFTQLVVGFPNP